MNIDTPDMEEAVSPESYAQIQRLLGNSTSESANPRFILQPHADFADGECAEYHTSVAGVIVKVRLTTTNSSGGQADHFVEVAASLGNSLRQLGAALPALTSVKAFLGIPESATA
jgi:hypothetical protein